MIGHASVQLTFDVYGHLMPDAFDDLVGRLDALTRTGAASSRARTRARGRRRGQADRAGATKNPAGAGLSRIAGAGFEPATFGL